MTDVEFLKKIEHYFKNHKDLKDGYFKEEDLDRLESFDKFDYFDKDSPSLLVFDKCVKDYFLEKAKDVHTFLARLSFLNDSIFYEKRIVLDESVPFKYDDILFLRYIIKKSDNYTNFFSFINTFIVFGFDYCFGSDTDVDRIKQLVNKFYSDQNINNKDNYNFVFRKSLSPLFYRFCVDIEECFNDISNYYDDFDFNSMIMAVYAEKKSFDLIHSKYSVADWTSKNSGDGHGFDILVPSNFHSKRNGKLYEIKATTRYPEYMTSLLTNNEGNVFLDTLRDDSFYDYFIHVYDMKVNNGRISSPDNPLELFYDRLNHKVYNNFDIPYKIIRNDNGRIGFQDELEKYKTLFYTK